MCGGYSLNMCVQECIIGHVWMITDLTCLMVLIAICHAHYDHSIQKYNMA